jgi:hypothetical protein
MEALFCALPVVPVQTFIPTTSTDPFATVALLGIAQSPRSRVSWKAPQFSADRASVLARPGLSRVNAAILGEQTAHTSAIA